MPLTIQLDVKIWVIQLSKLKRNKYHSRGVAGVKYGTDRHTAVFIELLPHKKIKESNRSLLQNMLFELTKKWFIKQFAYKPTATTFSTLVKAVT